MRCEKCGFENPTGVTCIKCGTPLQKNGYSVNNDYRKEQVAATRIMNGPSSLEAQQLKATVLQNGKQGREPSPTVLQNDFWKLAQKDSEKVTFVKPIEINGQLKCPECKYPVTDKLNSCPNCGANFTEKSEEPPVLTGPILIKCENCNKEVPFQYSFCPYCGSKIEQKTIMVNPNVSPAEDDESNDTSDSGDTNPICRLILLSGDDGQIEAKTNRYEGSTVVLNRNNTEPNNRTITSKEQAKLYFDKGKWFIENFSQYNSTMLIAGRKMELQPGDIVILGDRKFKFEVGE